MVVLAVRLLCMFLCSWGLTSVSVALNDNYIDSDPYQILAVAVAVILGVLIGYVLGGVFGRSFANLLGGVDSGFFHMTGSEIIVVVLGVIVSMVIALLPSIALFRFAWPGSVLSFMLFIFFAFLGGRVAFVKREDFVEALRLPSSPGLGGGGSEIILDTSVIIDGRIVDVAKAGFLDGIVVVPKFVLEELQSIADSADRLKRSRGRRGLDSLNALRRIETIALKVTEEDYPDIPDVDSKLTFMSRTTGIPLLTNDFNLNKVAELQGARIRNINQLAVALHPVVLPGEHMEVSIVREGREEGQGVAYLDDGTMVVVDRGKEMVGMEEVPVIATSVLQTSAGRMLFAELKEDRGKEE